MLPDKDYKIGFNARNPVERTENRVVLNYSLSIPECFYLAFLEAGIKTGLAKEPKYVWIGASASMQEVFDKYVKGQVDQFTPEELDLNKIVTSIWNKTRNYIARELQLKEDLEGIKDENVLLKETAELEKACVAVGNKGKLFTVRQLNHILNFLKQVAASQGK